VRELRNHGGRVLARVAAGETLTVTRHGRPVAELRPIAPKPVPAHVLVERRRTLPDLDPKRLRTDLDHIVEPTL